jgi:drug/metabolite transporter (DMT)-like permease
LSSLGPIIVVFGGYIGYQERLRRPQILGIALILLGIVLATLPA